MPLPGRPDPDRSDRPVVALAAEYEAGAVTARHRHGRAQLLFVVQGTMRVETDAGLWLTPPGRAAWIPGHVGHRASYPHRASLRTAYIDAGRATGLPTRCAVLNLSPLLRELVLEAVRIGWHYPDGGPEDRLMRVLIDQIATQASAPLFLPEGRDPRLCRVTTALKADPADARTLEDWAALAGTSPRTLARLFLKETGMAFAAWRQQLRMTRAVELLTAGATITRTAFELGYGSSSAFTTMFTRAMGEPPRRYFRRDA